MPIDHKPTKILADSYFRRLLICKKKKKHEPSVILFFKYT